MGIKNLFKDIYYLKDILIVVLTPIILIPFLVVGDSSEAKCAYCVIIMAVFWISEALPIAVTSLLPVFLFPVVGLLSVKDTAHQYIKMNGLTPHYALHMINSVEFDQFPPIRNIFAFIFSVGEKAMMSKQDINMLLLGGLMVAAAIEHWNIHKRIALRILLLVGAEARWIMLGLMVPTWFLSMWISNTATTAMMIPIANAILMKLKATGSRVKSGSATVRSKAETPLGTDNEAVELEDVNMPEKPPVGIVSAVDGDVETKKDQNIGIEDENEQKKVDFDNMPDNVLRDDDDPAFRRLCKCITLSIAYSANVGGIGSLTGTGPNLVMKGQLDIVYEKYGILHSPITFTSWMGFGVPLSLSLVIIIWIWLQFLFLRCNGCCQGKNVDRDIRVKAVIRTEYEKLGPVSFAQAATMGHFLLLAVLWITRDMGGEYGWGFLFKKGFVNNGAPAIFIATSLFVFPTTLPQIFCFRPDGNREPLRPLMSWKTTVEKVPWGVIFLLGGGFAMAYASQESGLSAWVGKKLNVLDFLSPWLLNLVLCYIVASMTEVTSNNATCTLMMPILANLAVHLKQNPIYLMLPSAIAVSFAFMLPVATPPNAVVFSYGYVRVVDMVIAGFVLNVVCVLVLTGFSESLGDHLFDFHIIPDEIMKVYNESST